MTDGWFEIRCEECDKIIGYAFNPSEEPCSWVYSCEACMNFQQKTVDKAEAK